jgi:polyisoprenoid-binding protein YceI
MRGLAAVALVAAAVTAAGARAEQWEAAPGAEDRVVVHVRKKGVFSAFAHDHHFEVTRWQATASMPDRTPASTSVKVVLFADSLRDRQEALSEGDRRKVNAQAAGPEVLDAEHHPRIEFRADRLELEPGGGPERLRAALPGTLTVRGRSAPVTLTVEAEQTPGAWRVHGSAHLKQSAFGIKPFRAIGGGVGVKDEVEIELSLTLRQSAR